MDATMTDEIVITIRPGEGIRAIHDDRLQRFLPNSGKTEIRRASHVEPVPSGPYANHWYVDMSPLGEAHVFCFWPPKTSRAEALQQEHDYIIKHWVTPAP